MPDEVPRPSPPAGSGDVQVDLVDWLYQFRAFFGRDPGSWQDWQHGLAYIARARAREKLRTADAVAAGMGNKGDDLTQWNADMKTIAGY